MADKMKEVGVVTADVMATFTKNYMLALKDVMIEDIKHKRYVLAKKALVAAKNAGKAPKPRRPRKKTTKVPRLSAKISYSYELDSGLDGYIVYAVTTEYGAEKVTSYKRYSQFKKFHSKSGEKVKGAKLPPPSSTFGKRNLTHEFRNTREKLLQEYLDAIVTEFNEKADAAAKAPASPTPPSKDGKKKPTWNDEVMSFFRIGQNEDAVYKETFQRAYAKTRWHYWQWSWVVYDTEEEAIGRLASEVVKDRMWSDMCSVMPAAPILRKKMMQTQWKIIQATVNPVVSAGWKAVRETVDKAKPVIAQTLEKSLTPLVQLQADLKIKVTEVLGAALAPVVDAIKGLIAPLAAELIPEMEKAVLAAAPSDKFTEYMADFEHIVVKEDVEKMKKISSEVAEIRTNAIKAVDEQLEKAVEPILGKFKSAVKVDALLSVFGPVARLNSLAKSFFEFIDPANQFEVIEKLIEWKKQIKEHGREHVEEWLDKEEWDIDYWQVWRLNSRIGWAGWNSAWYLYRLLPDAYDAVRVFERFVADFQKLNEYSFYKKFSWKFGDYLHEAAKKCNTEEEFHQAVDQTFLIGYQRMVKHFKKHWMYIVVKNMKLALRALFVDKISKVLQEGAKEALEPIAALIVPPFDNLLDIQSIVSQAIKENIDNALDETISAIHPSLAKAVTEIRAQEPTEKQIWETPVPEAESASSPPGSPAAGKSD